MRTTPYFPAHLAGALALAAALGAQAGFDVRPVPLAAQAKLMVLDYFAWDAATRRLWVPGGDSGSVLVIDGATDAVRTIAGFATKEFTLGTKRFRQGPSSVAVGEGVVYIGNRADASLCAIDARTLKRGRCVLAAPSSAGWEAAPDGIVYVAATKELWITRGAPPIGIASSDKSLTVFDASGKGALVEKARIALGGSAEGFAVDAERFYTNIEETGETLAIDVRRREIAARWKSGCDEARGLALDRGRGILFVACSARVVSMDVRHGGKVLGSLDTGEGLDNIDYSELERTVYAAAARAAKLTIARVDDAGKFTTVAVVPTVNGARGVVAGDSTTAYVADPFSARILVVSPDGRS